MPRSVLESAAYRERLVASLQQSGALLSASVADAFSAIPREPFIRSFYESTGRTWTLHGETPGEQWLEWIYRDEALVTCLDAQNMPLSSSSQPSIMAAMLEALDVKPGQRVLEIGTGTGYNAALLARLADDPSLITTVELDATMAQQAEAILFEIIGQVDVHAGDGSLGVSSQMPYDRVIATASSSGIPRPWYEQLAPGGRLVMPLQGSLQASGFLVIQKGEKEGRGQFHQPSLHFISMRSEGREPSVSTTSLFQQPVAGDVCVDAGDPLLAAFQEPAFRWFLQWVWPQEGDIQIHSMKLPDGRQAWLLKDPPSLSILQLTQQANGSWLGKQRGNFPLWQTIQQASERFLALGKPVKETSIVQLDSQRAELFACSHNGALLPLRNLYRM
jgi:protein-L-isoaspartate(D-aspartate) O-methyltransferase